MSVIGSVISSVISAGDDTALPTFQVFDIPSDVESAYGSTRYGVKISQSGTAQYDSLVIQDDNPNTDTSNTLRYMQVSNHITKLRSDDPFDVEVTMLAGTPITDVVIKPLALNITPVINGDKVTFTVPGPYHVTVQINESTEEYSDNTTIGPFTKRIVKHPLFIEARSIETDVPADDDPTYTIYEPGITTVGLNQALANGDKVYFKPWAVVKIGYVASQADPSNIHVHGNGVITHDGLSATGSGWVDHVFDFTGNSVGGGVSSNGTGNILDGITIFAPLRAAIVCYNAVTCKQMSMYSWLHQQDGITAGEGSVGESWNFVKTRDDQFKIYYQNQTWEQLIIWQMSSGSPAKFGWNLSSNVQNFLVEDMTLIESDVFNSYSTEQETEGDGPEYYDTSALFACMGINSTGSVTDVVFNNITVDTPYLHRFMGVRFQSFQGGQYWGNPASAVVFSGLVVKNLSLMAAPPAKSFIYANQGGSAENIIFQNVTVDGTAVNAYDLLPCANFTPGIALVDDGLGGTVSDIVFSPRNISVLDSSSSQYFDIGSSITADRIVIDVYPTSGNSGLPTGVPSVTDGTFQELDYTLSGGSVQYIGRNGSSYFDGYIKNVRIYNGSTLLVDSPLDESWTSSTKARNRAADIAVISTTAPTTTNSPWTDNADGSFSIDGSQGGNTNIYYQNVMTLDNDYLLIIVVSDSTAGGVRPYSSEINSETVTSGNGTFEFEFTPSSNDDINIQANSDFDGTVTFEIIDVTVAPAYLVPINIEPRNSNPFALNISLSGREWSKSVPGHDIRTEGDSLMAGAYGNAVNAELASLIVGQAVTNTAVGGSTMDEVLARVTSPGNSPLLNRVTVFWDGYQNGLTTVSEYADLLESAIDELGHPRFLVIPPINPYTSTYSGSVPESVKAEYVSRWPNNFLDWNTFLDVDKNLINVDGYGVPAAYDSVLSNESENGFTLTKSTTHSRAYINIAVAIGLEYRVQGSISGTADFTLFVRASTNGSGTIVYSSSATSFDFTFVATVSDMCLLFADTLSSELIVSNLSVTPPSNSIDKSMFHNAPNDPYHVSALGAQQAAAGILEYLENAGWYSEPASLDVG